MNGDSRMAHCRMILENSDSLLQSEGGGEQNQISIALPFLT